MSHLPSEGRTSSPGSSSAEFPSPWFWTMASEGCHTSRQSNLPALANRTETQTSRLVDHPVEAPGKLQAVARVTRSRQAIPLRNWLRYPVQEPNPSCNRHSVRSLQPVSSSTRPPRPHPPPLFSYRAREYLTARSPGRPPRPRPHRSQWLSGAVGPWASRWLGVCEAMLASAWT